MTLRLLLSRLLLIFAITGLLTAPMVTPSAAEAMVGASMAAKAEMASLSDGTPCCADQKQSLPDCLKSCPLTTLCAAKCFPNGPVALAPAVLPPPLMAAAAPPFEDAGRSHPADPPPPRPPRT